MDDDDIDSLADLFDVGSEELAEVFAACESAWYCAPVVYLQRSNQHEVI